MDVVKDVPLPMSLGSVPLLNRVKKVKPALHCFGHIHSSQGLQEAETLFVNAACLGEDYCFSNTKRFMEIEMNFPIKKPTIKL
jgi:Icc-related predicted phosphoesterase